MEVFITLPIHIFFNFNEILLFNESYKARLDVDENFFSILDLTKRKMRDVVQGVSQK